MRDIGAEPVRVIIAVLAGMEGVREAALYGLAFHVILAPELDPGEFQRRIEAAGLTVTSFAPIAPTLEDAFISMLL